MANAVMPSSTGDSSDSSDSDNDAVATAVAKAGRHNSASHSLGFDLHRSLLAIERYTAAATAREGGADDSDNDDSSTLHFFHREHLSVAAVTPASTATAAAVHGSAVLIERPTATSSAAITTAAASAVLSTTRQYRPQSPTTHTPPAQSPRIALVSPAVRSERRCSCSSKQQRSSNSSSRDTTTAAVTAVVAVVDDSTGPAVGMQECELMALLQQPPKTVPQLRSQEGLRRFFRGITQHRMRRCEAYATSGLLSAADAQRKIAKRIRLLS
jgi:hypothetical protein